MDYRIIDSFGVDQEDYPIILVCEGCGAEYEVSRQDIEEIAVEGKVTCECGGLISVTSQSQFAYA